MNRAVLWITLTCCCYSWTHADGDDCNIQWKIVQSQTCDLVVEWSEAETLHNSTVKVKFTTNDTHCRVASGNTLVDFSDQRLELQTLCPNTEYTIFILFNCSSYSEVIWTPPGPPVNVTILEEDITNTSFKVSWTAPPGTGDIELYRVNVNDTLNETADTSLLYAGLRPFTTYQVQVTAKNKNYTGKPSPTLDVKTGVGVPYPPRNLEAMSHTHTSISLSWEEPTPPTGPILFYVVWSSGGDEERERNATEAPCNVTGLEPYTRYRLKVSAVTAAGSGPWTEEMEVQTDVGVPHVPSTLQSTSVTNTSVTLTWLPPFPSTGPILAYTVMWNSSRDGGQKYTESNRTEYQLSGLLPYVQYTFRVKATNTAGHGKWSDPTTVRTDVGVPHAPTGLTFTSVTNTSIGLSWKEPSPFTGPILTYVVLWSRPGSTGIVITQSNRTFYEIPGLLPYVNYTFQVVAKTKAGRGAASESIPVKTSAGVPHAPTALEQTLVTNTSVALTWKEPTPCTGPILSYVLLWSVSMGTSEQKDTGSNSTSFVVSGLLPYVSYTFQVLASTEAGRGEGSRNITVQTDIGVPHEPTELKRAAVTNTSVSLTWKEPSPSTGPILTYVVLWSSPGNDTRELNIHSNLLGYLIDGLLPFVQYTFRVLAATSVGRGSESGSVVIQTGIGVPNAPKALTQNSVKNTSVALAWQKPYPSTGPILTYVVRWNSARDNGEKDTHSNVSQYEVLGLQPYLEYTFQVLAVTLAGRGIWSDEKTLRTEVGVPHAPTALRLASITNTSAILMWKEPSPSTGPISTYIVLWSSRGLAGFVITRSNQTLHEIPGLLPYVDYSFRVLAETKAGRGAVSESIQVETLVGVPHAPKALTYTSFKNTSVALVWKEPEPSTGPILTYVVRWSSARSGEKEKDISSNVSRFEVPGLEPYLDYAFQVLAVTLAGRGAWSEKKFVQTGIGVPHAPQALAPASVKNESVDLSWQEPYPSTGPILTYVIRWRSAARDDDGESDTFSNGLRYEVSGLQPYLNYTFQVLAVTLAGRGPWSEKKIVWTDIGIPTIPRHLIQEHLTDVSVSIRWDQPQFPNGPDLRYEVRWTLASDTNRSDELSSHVHSNQPSVQHMISGLLPYSYYSTRVVAITRAGSGPWTDNLLFRTAVGVPKPAVLYNITAQGTRTVLVEWSTTGPFPGPVDYSLQAWMSPSRCSDRPSSYIAKEVKGIMKPGNWSLATQRNKVTQLTPYGTYHFLIVLRTSAADGIPSDQSSYIQIAPEAAGEPTDVTADCRSSSTEAKVSWKPPEHPNGIINSYDVEFSVDSKRWTINVPVKNPCIGWSHVLTGLRPERPYKIMVYARVESVSAAGKPAPLKETCILPAGIPTVGNISHLLAKGSGSDHLNLEWTRNTFSEFMGSIVHYAVLVGKRNTLGNSTSGTAIDRGPPWSDFSSGLSDFYQATPPLWNPFTQDADPLSCVEANNRTLLHCPIGAQDICPDNETYCNGPLQPDTQYEMKIRAFTRGGYAETYLIYARTGPRPRSSPVGAVVAVIIVLLLVASLAAGFYVMKKNGHLDPLVESVQTRFGLRGAHSTSVESSLERSTLPRPIGSRHFEDHVRIMMSDSHLKFSLEFEMLKNESPHPPSSVAEMEENRFKNRWMNIFPFDHSRVKLLPLSDEPGSDFINANYIPGYSSRREYIATQGPLPHTGDDFWRMLWEQSVSTVVMLTQCVERGKKKCEQYWPESGEARYYGDLRVATVSESMLASYVIRIFHVQLGSHERRIKQMHFTHWPDFGCPESPEDLINFVRAVRDHLPRPEPGPILVHCSAGVGRTGTFIAVDRLSQQLSYRHIPQNDLVDIYGTVLELRNHRTNMVQTEDQYIYIHMCVRQLIRERDAPPQEDSDDLVYSNIGVQRDTCV